MGIWKARLMALLSVVAMLVAFSAPVALADNCEVREGSDKVVCSDDGDRQVFTENELENELLDGDDDDGDEFFLSGLDDDEFDFFGLGFGFEFEDIDCDEIEDDDDPVFDEGLCEVEGEFFGEDVEFTVEADELFFF